MCEESLKEDMIYCQVTSGGHTVYVRLPPVGTQCMSSYLRWAHSVCQVISGGHTVYVRLPQVGTQCMPGYLRWAHSVCQVTSSGHIVYVRLPFCESTKGYTFTPCVESFTSPGKDTR